MMPFWKKLARAAQNMRADVRGNVAATFAIAAVPIIGTVGFAVDYSHANSVKAAMQAALDSTALMLSKDAATLSQTALQTKAKNYFDSLFTKPEATNVSVVATYTATGGSTVVVTGSAQVPTAFLGIIGHNTITVNGSSTSKWGTSRLRVALALDTTGSMESDGKMAAMKTATKSLLTQLQTAATTNGDVYVSIVPFSKNVNAGANNYSASWVDWTDWESEPPILKTSKPSNWSSIGPGSSCPFSNNSYGFTCQSTPTNGSSSTNTIPSNGTYAGYICPTKDSGRQKAELAEVYYNGCYNSVPITTTTTTTVGTGRWASCSGYSNCTCTGSGSNKVCTQTTTTTTGYSHTWIPNAKSTWTGCTTDRGLTSGPSTSNYDQKSDAPGTAADSKFPAQQYNLCSKAMMGLNYNWSTMSTFVDSLQPDGNTNQPIGLVWAWQSLVGGGPLSVPAKDTNYTYTDVIILLSDGLNTANRWYTSQTPVDKRMYDSSNNGAGTCANIKAAGVTIYTIQVNTGGDATSTIMRNCASTTDKFFLLTSASQMITAFNTIGTNLTKLRVAK